MIKRTEWNKKLVAENYDFGRPLDEQVIIDLFIEILKYAPELEKNALLLDAGCGTGRVTLPIAKYFPAISIIGIDTSKEMLAVLNRKISEFKPDNYKVETGDLFKVQKQNDLFDAVLISSVLHASENWRSIVDELIRVIKPNGFLFLISEQSDLYDLYLERIINKNTNIMEKFWGKYNEFRIKNNFGSFEASQVGIKWQLGHPEVIQYLREKSLIKNINEITHVWKKRFTIKELMQIIEIRCFSGMFTADDKKYEALVKDMKRWIAEEHISLNESCMANNILMCEVVQIKKK